MNKDNAKDYLPLIQALAEGKTIQYHSKAKDWVDTLEVEFLHPLQCYRIKPSPTYREWKPEEVPLGAWIRSKGCRLNPNNHDIAIIIGRSSEVNRACVYTSFSIGNSKGNFEYADKCFQFDEHSTDQGKTWHPCGIKVEE